MGTLYIVATPIGNLDDITIRAIKTLLAVPVIACEDTRRTGLLINLLNKRYSASIFNLQFTIYKKKYISVRDWNEAEVVAKILTELYSGDVALVSDAGTPLLSDPGFKLVRAARTAGFTVSPIPGPFAGAAALSAAGLPTNKIMFWGFLPKKWELPAGMTHVIYESPVRLAKTLEKISEKYADAEIVIAQEMTKIHEKFMIYDSGFMSKNKGEATILVFRREGGKEVSAAHVDGDGKVQQG